MARSYKRPVDRRHSQYGHEEAAREEIRPDEGVSGPSFVWLYGEAIGMTPEQLLEHANDLIQQHAEMVAELLKHVPRKHEDKIKALAEPRREAESAIRATAILIGNQRRVFEAPDYPKEA